MAEFTSLLAKNYRDGETYHDWSELSEKISLEAGYKWENSNFVMCIKFELPTAAKSITLEFCNAENGMTVNQNLRYKLTRIEDESLFNATSDILGDGAFTVRAGNYVKTTLTINKTLPSGIHYIYIWTNDSNVTSNVMWIRWHDDEYGFVGSYEKLDSCIYIYNGSEWDAYEVYIDNGSVWDLYAPYIDNGSSWDAVG